MKGFKPVVLNLRKSPASREGTLQNTYNELAKSRASGVCFADKYSMTVTVTMTTVIIYTNHMVVHIPSGCVAKINIP
jgi:hypothetical protein